MSVNETVSEYLATIGRKGGLNGRGKSKARSESNRTRWLTRKRMAHIRKRNRRAAK